MLETLLNHFRSYGLNDLEFIIVNSKLSHAQDRLHELKSRVSFDVLQETEEEEVWNLMEGGKDDMYIYDRCGRLTFYIPFPLSILNETPLVANAILTTYFRSPCGDKCMQNNTMDFGEFVKNMERNLETSNETEQINETQVETEMPYFINETQNETSSSNDLLSVIDPIQDEVNTLNTSLPTNATDYDYPDYDNSNVNNTTNSTNADKAKTYFNSIYKLFFNNDKNSDDQPETNETIANDSNTTELYQSYPDYNSTHEHKKHNHTQHDHKHHNHHHHHPHHPHQHHPKNEHNHTSKGNKKSDRCLEADYQVCRGWTKKRLLHAQKCCSGKKFEVDISDPKSCYNFGKKRCKKIQSILKCCIKTVYVETSSNVTLNETASTPPESEFATKTEDELRSPSKPTTQTSDITCCKSVDNGKVCRVIDSGNCKEGEYIESTSVQSKCINPPCNKEQSSEGGKNEKSAMP